MKLGDLDKIKQDARYRIGNAGLSHDFQFINVGLFEGQGETTPQAFFYQNLGEAEYCVALFMYMRLCGYPAEKITILTTYNGQKHLIRDVVQQRCNLGVALRRKGELDRAVDAFRAAVKVLWKRIRIGIKTERRFS